MLHGVDLDAAWGQLGAESSAAGQRPPPAPPPPPPRSPVPPSEPDREALPDESRRERMGGSARRSARRGVVPNAVADSSEAVNELAREVCDLRKQLQAQAGTATVVMYAGLVIGILLLVVIAQSQARLHHATEALLWTIHR